MTPLIHILILAQESAERELRLRALLQELEEEENNLGEEPITTHIGKEHTRCQRSDPSPK